MSQRSLAWFMHALASLCLLTLGAPFGRAQTTAFTYQGKLTDGVGPATGSYDFQFKLFDALSAGTQISTTQSPTSVAVSGGIFTVTLDFGAAAFPGANRWLEISVRLAGGGAFTTLAPRQPITATPYAIKSLNAAAADGLSAACNGCVTSTQIGSLPATSGNYIQNGTALQASSNFNISGNGFIGGNVGIGTASPASRLHVLRPSNHQLLLENNATGGGFWYISQLDNSFSAGGGKLAFVPDTPTTSAATVVFTNGGRVGIGTTDPLYPLHVVTPNTSAIFGQSTSLEGVFGLSASDTGVRGQSTSGTGVLGITSVSSLTSAGVFGKNLASGGIGVIGEANNGTATAGAVGVYGTSASSTGFGMYGRNLNGGYAGFFEGKVRVTGVIEKPGGGFKIDHPLDPENKYLVHSFVESPDMKNLYDGTVTTDASGEAEITLPDWFAALNRDFRYQLTCIGVFAQAIIAEEIKDNRFKIRTSLPNVKVSWQVTGTRQDAWANQHRLPVEEAKPAVERGFYQNPSAFGQPEERGLEWAIRPAQMKEQKEAREKAARAHNDQTAAPAARPNNQ